MARSDTISVQIEGRSGATRNQAFLTLVLRADEPLQPGTRFSLDEAEKVSIGRGADQGARIEGGVLWLSLADRRVSSRHAMLHKISGHWNVEDLDSKNGTFVNGDRIRKALPLADGDVIEVGHSFMIFRDDVPAPWPTPTVQLGSELNPHLGLVTFSPPLAEEFIKLGSIAASRVPVMVRGETGTGKEIIAAAIHKASALPGELVAVNCAGLSRNLVESELFGYRKGAFSGAEEDRPGLIRSADRGTLFLDEFAELPLPAQAALLRVIQESEVLPVGGTRPVRVDLRVVVATHRDLETLVTREELRADLVARVSGFTLTLPPLRERREDLGLLVAALLRRHEPERSAGVSFSTDAARAILVYQWPLNVRELEQALTAACALARWGHIELRHLPPTLCAALDGARRENPAEPPLGDDDRRLYEQLESLLREHGGNVSAVAQAMGKFRSQVQRWIRRFGLVPKDFRR